MCLGVGCVCRGGGECVGGLKVGDGWGRGLKCESDGGVGVCLSGYVSVCVHVDL